MKFCKDCKYAVRTKEHGLLECAKSQGPSTVDLVTGNETESYRFLCTTSRSESQMCGSDGKWFESKPVKPTLAEKFTRWLTK